MEKITTKNLIDFLEELRKSNFKSQPADMHDFVMESTEYATNWEAYSDPDIKEVIDTYLEQVNAFFWQKQTSEVKSETKKQPKKTEESEKEVSENKPHKKNKVEKARKVNPEPEIEPEDLLELTERIPDEIRFIRRFIGLRDKKKNKHEILLFINALHRAIFEKRIRKTSKYAKQILYIQDKLVKTFNGMDKWVVVPISAKIVEDFKDAIASEKVYPSIMLLKRYVGLNGKYGVKDKAKNLMEAMTRAFNKGRITKSDKYYKVFDKMHHNLNQYVKNKSQKILSIQPAELNGLNGIVGINVEEQVSGTDESDALHGITSETLDRSKGGKIMSLTEARNAKFDTLGLTGGYLHLIGEACKPTNLFVYGDGGSGKSSFLLKYAEYLNHLGNKILYIAGEQYNTPTFTELLKRLNIIGNKDFVIVKDLNALKPADFDFVVLDSKDSLGINVEDFRELKRVYPNQSFLVSSQGTKTGDFTGSGQWRNEVDTMIYCEAGVAKTDNDKNRWGGKGEMRIIEADSEIELAGIKKKPGGKNIKSEDHEPADWTEAPFLTAADHARLKAIKKHYEKGEMAMAMDLAMSGDTEIREAIPGDIWVKMGGFRVNSLKK